MNVLVTGSSGLIGSEAVTFFDRMGFRVIGVDNNMRADFFGPQGDTTKNRARLEASCKHFTHREMDIRDRAGVDALFAEGRFDLVIHAAAQPSHDLAAKRPFDDFDVNAGGTLNLLEACRRHTPEAVFIFMSTNKVYGDAPNHVALRTNSRPAGTTPISPTSTASRDLHHRPVASLALRRHQGRGRRDHAGVRPLLRDEDRRLPRRLPHRPVTTRAWSCTASSTTSVLAPWKSARTPIFGYKGKQVRDQIHCPRRHRRLLGLRPGAAPGRGLQPRRRQAQLLRAILECVRHRREVLHQETRPTLLQRPPTASATTSATTPTWRSSGATTPSGGSGTHSPRSSKKWRPSPPKPPRPEGPFNSNAGA